VSWWAYLAIFFYFFFMAKLVAYGRKKQESAAVVWTIVVLWPAWAVLFTLEFVITRLLDLAQHAWRLVRG
jgi:uncharacterized membrane protein YoaK (UPF0700 family)